MRNLLIWALVIGGGWYWYSHRGVSAAGLVDADGKPQVVVFTFDECGAPCTDELEELTKRTVPFRELVISPDRPDEDNYKLWEQLGSVRSFPLVVAGKEQVSGTSRMQLATLLAVNFDMTYLTDDEQRYYKHHVTNGQPNIVLYGTSWCPGCKQLREDMRAAGVEFVDIDVDARKDKAELLATLEIGGYPATWYGYRRMRSTNWAGIQAEMH